MKKVELGSRFFNLNCYGGIECVNANFKDQHFSKHVHEGYAIGVIEYGAQRFFSEGRNHLSGPGSLVIVNADSAHTGSPASDSGWGYKAMYPTPDLFDDLLSDVTLKSKSAPHFHDSVINDKSLVNQLELIFSTLTHTPSTLMLETLIYAFFMKLALSTKQDSSVTPTKRANKPILQARDYIHAYSHEEIALDTLSSMTGLSKYYFIRQFQSLFGITPHQYQIQSRLQKAKALLRHGKRPIQVALECGFCDQSHMNIHFKKALGTTPYQYQKRIIAL